ncbi:AzlD domain-containing protein [Natrialba sp. PRR66]|uniref:AzlD domain-containing protein n=1 Tax=Natrialba sp. PRR66 TaxID=3098146 RepID=UPI002B1D9686|nr:AzlD domain-containing protein [Natrialba sp. PRR66]
MMTEYEISTLWLIFIVIGIGTYALRLSFILFLGRLGEVPPYFSGLLRFVPATILAALVAPTLIVLTAEPTISFEADRAKLVAGAIAAFVAWRTENVLATIGVGMGVLWGLQAIF